MGCNTGIIQLWCTLSVALVLNNTYIIATSPFQSMFSYMFALLLEVTIGFPHDFFTLGLLIRGGGTTLYPGPVETIHLLGPVGPILGGEGSRQVGSK